MYASIAILAQEQNGLCNKRECVGVSANMGLMCVWHMKRVSTSMVMHMCTSSVGYETG